MEKKTDGTFTSESVCAGHPDKVCDQISDAIVDAVLGQDPYGHVAIESLATTNRLVIAGEITAKAKVDFKGIAKREIARLGYVDPILNFTPECDIAVYVHEQSPEIAKGVKVKGAGDQGMMFGFACDETESLMPLPIAVAHALARQIDLLRETSVLPYLRPDGKTQVTVAYKNGRPHAISQVVLAAPHKESVDIKTVKHDLYNHVVKPILDLFGFTIPEKNIIVNGTGVWHMSGPAVDCGLTGRKIIVDTYGGYARVGGGCFSGKDPTKVDRSGAYAARFLAKQVVSQKLARKAEVRLAYYIGAKKPVMQEVETFGTAKVTNTVLKDFLTKSLDTSVEGIIAGLSLRAPIYLPTAAYGHFGRNDFPWEQIKTNI